jgi:hypothetical protein
MGTTRAGTMERVGVGGTINGYGILVLGDIVVVAHDGEEVARRTVEDLGRFANSACDLRLGWGRFPDGAEVISLYDRADGNFGYTLNLTWPNASEWGTCWFPAMEEAA